MDLVNLAGLVEQKAFLTNPDRELTNTLPIPSFSKSKVGKKIHSGIFQLEKKTKQNNLLLLKGQKTKKNTERNRKNGERP